MTRFFPENVLSALRGQLVVSVQAEDGEPFADPTALTAMALSVLAGGAAGLRMANAETITRIRALCPEVPLIAITKPKKIPDNFRDLVYITPTWQDVAVLAEAGADIIAMDATARPRPGGETLEALVRQARELDPKLLLMADVATVDEGLAAARLGFDIVSTTLAGYTRETAAAPGDPAAEAPDFALLETLARTLKIPVILEGRVWEPAQVRQAFELGAYAVVIGSAITRPHLITARFRQALPG